MFAASLLGFAAVQLVAGDFVLGRAPAWPEGVPGRLVWSSATAVIVAVAGIAIALERRARIAAGVVATLVLVWAVARNVAPALTDRHYGAAWTMLGKSIALFGGAVAFAAPTETSAGARAVPRVCLGAFLISSGVQHFLFADFVAQLVPSWIPGAVFWTYFAGVALIAGGAGIMFPPATRLASALSGMMIAMWVVLLHVPRALAAADAGRLNEWLAVCEAIAFAGIAFVLTEGSRARRASSRASFP